MSEETYVTTGEGLRLFVQQVGSGPNVVLIPNATYMFDDFKYLADKRTVIFYDLRNRGRSDAVSDPSRLRGGVRNDVDDLEAIRRHFDADRIDVVGHSYLGMVVALYAMKYPEHLRRAVLIGTVQPEVGKQYPAHLTGADSVAADINDKLAQLQKEGPAGDLAAFGKKMWFLMRQLYVADPADAGKIQWSVEHLPNESFFNLMRHYNENLYPSMQSLRLSADDFAKVTMPVLAIHGRRDRQAPYGGAREWVLRLPNARLITIENAAHVPWIESPATVFDSIATFLDGAWPPAAQPVKSLDVES